MSQIPTNLIGDVAGVTKAETVEKAKSALETTRWSLVILDIGMNTIVCRF